MASFSFFTIIFLNNRGLFSKKIFKFVIFESIIIFFSKIISLLSSLNSNEEKKLSYEFKPSEIFKASDMMVDSLTGLISRKRNKK